MSFQCGFHPFANSECFTDSREHNYIYIHNESRLCNGEVFLLMVVLSTPSDFIIRQTIRETWGSFASSKSNIRLAFMLGKLESEIFDKKIEEESENHHDIIQKDFIDSYGNLTLKSESILHYSAFFCQNAQYILKVDSDMFINVPLLLDSLKNSDDGVSIIGHKLVNERPIVNKTEKWYIDPSTYPLSYFPDFTSGTCYVIPGIFTKSLFKMSLKTRLIRLEDVYITGILRARLSLPIRDDDRFHTQKCGLNPCSTLLNSISCHRHTSDEIIQLWGVFEKCFKMCSDSNTCFNVT
ncbi:hypothetical protein LOTGIDRAFT_119959 [Lottia gigantea]|uniref:Hexosyltransferase n=1 Tax=Lottia gigantea TaxID=225164 RepID=V3ZNX4_LOTGI|nr:hypothetical protein LOTGIDRAFT_119959 [Lottia gigantea]ESO93078.1 hypothetical protein LOTGIDRAFT_119959 [Lottia gigantea]